MSIVYKSEVGFLLSHQKLIEKIYRHVHSENTTKPMRYKSELFDINVSYKKITCKQQLHNTKHDKNATTSSEQEATEEMLGVKEKFYTFVKELQVFLKVDKKAEVMDNNKLAIDTSESVYESCKNCKISDSIGYTGQEASKTTINGNNFIFPENAEFFCKDVSEINKSLADRKFDLILMDPPWWNKYIRRKRKKSNNAYDMMYNVDLKNIPVDSLLTNTGLVVVWCTNSLQHINCVKNELFPKWGVKYVATWFWVKITTGGEPICNFSLPPGKQPYERIIFGTKEGHHLDIREGKLLLSVPSALHSHKPPLTDILKEFIPENVKCLEIFARYLMPNWTSFGLEATLLQNESIFEEVS